MFACAWITAARTIVIVPASLCSLSSSSASAERWQHVLPEPFDDPGRAGILLHRIDVELRHAERFEFAQLADACVGGAQNAESVHDLVGHELCVLGTGPPV